MMAPSPWVSEETEKEGEGGSSLLLLLLLLEAASDLDERPVPSERGDLLGVKVGV